MKPLNIYTVEEIRDMSDGAEGCLEFTDDGRIYVYNFDDQRDRFVSQAEFDRHFERTGTHEEALLYRN